MRRRRIKVMALTGVIALVVAACGGDDDESQPEETADTTEAPVDEPVADDEPATVATEASDATTETTAADEPAADGEPITVGIITSTSGLLGVYGGPWLEGLEAGLDYATDGTGAVNGRPIKFEIVDDAGEPERAITAATDLIGRDVNVIAGTLSSGIALQLGPFAEENEVLYITGGAAADQITGLNRNTFRAGRQTYQDVATVAALLDDVAGSDILVYAQETAFGQGNSSAVQAVLGGMGANVSELLVPATATEFTPFTQQVLDADPDLLFVAWAGETAPAMFLSLQQQGVFEEMKVTTGLGDVASYSGYGQDPSAIEFISHFVPGTLDNPVHNAMADRIDGVDIFTPDGFVTSMMIVRALSEAGSDDVEGMIEALEGWSFDAPKGPQTIRASDHAMLQPMFTAGVEGTPGDFVGVIRSTIPPEETAPPETPFG